MKRGHSKPSAFTLTELMISLAVATLISIVIMAIFVQQRRAYKATNLINQMVQNVRFAGDSIARDIHTAGYGLPAAGLNGQPIGWCTRSLNGTAAPGHLRQCHVNFRQRPVMPGVVTTGGEQANHRENDAPNRAYPTLLFRRAHLCSSTRHGPITSSPP